MIRHLLRSDYAPLGMHPTIVNDCEIHLLIGNLQNIDYLIFDTDAGTVSAKQTWD